jgi:hypothetical protein
MTYADSWGSGPFTGRGDVRVINEEQDPTTYWLRGGANRLGAVHTRWIALFALGLWACLADGKPALTGLGGLVSIADGEPFTIIRRATLRTGSKGVTLVAGDIVETGPGAFLAIEMQGGSLVGIGPSTQVYFMPRADVATLVVLKGSVKADIRAGSKGGAMRVIGTRLGIQSHQAVVLLYADERSDAVFDEQGSARLLLRDGAATRLSKDTQQNQFFVREDGRDEVSQPRPSAEFVAKIPIPFRDALPEHASAKVKPVAAQLVREVTYSDIQTWLTMPRDWRTGFIGRFRGRLKDPAFFAAMDAHMVQHPEWLEILHPPPPPEEEVPPDASRLHAQSPPH